MKCLMVPKLELQALFIAMRLKVDIYKVLPIPFCKSFTWTNSMTVLPWLRSFGKQTIFVANRVSEILESTTIDQWFYVPSADKPAEVSKRGMSADSMFASS